MSRLAKKPIKLPEGVSLSEEAGLLVIKGPKGEKKLRLPLNLYVESKDGDVWIKSKIGGKDNEAILGTYWSLIKNATRGVKEGFLKILEIEGVGYKAALEDKEIVLHLGYAVPVRFILPSGITAEIEKNTIKISGVDKELVGQVAADLRSLKKPEPYKGKGIRYKGEIIRRKVGKKAAATATT